MFSRALTDFLPLPFDGKASVHETPTLYTTRGDTINSNNEFDSSCSMRDNLNSLRVHIVVASSPTRRLSRTTHHPSGNPLYRSPHRVSQAWFRVLRASRVREQFSLLCLPLTTWQGQAQVSHLHASNPRQRCPCR